LAGIRNPSQEPPPALQNTKEFRPDPERMRADAAELISFVPDARSEAVPSWEGNSPGHTIISHASEPHYEQPIAIGDAIQNGLIGRRVFARAKPYRLYS
jgi:hypothetical protein